MNLLTSRSHEPLINKKREKKARKPIRNVAKARAKLNREYMKLRAEFLDSHPFCQWFIRNNIMPNTMLTMEQVEEFAKKYWTTIPPSTEIHHQKGRGKFLLDTSTWMAVSSEGHRAIHADPKTSYLKGYMLPRR